MHTIWLSAVLPLMLFVVWAFPESRVPGIWSMCFWIAILGMAVVVGVDLFGFYWSGGKLEHGLMRSVFALITATDLPVTPLAIGSVLNWMISRRAGKAAVRSQIEKTNFETAIDD